MIYDFSWMMKVLVSTASAAALAAASATFFASVVMPSRTKKTAALASMVCMAVTGSTVLVASPAIDPMIEKIAVSPVLLVKVDELIFMVILGFE
jgi:hypothetical protein